MTWYWKEEHISNAMRIIPLNALASQKTSTVWDAVWKYHIYMGYFAVLSLRRSHVQFNNPETFWWKKLFKPFFFWVIICRNISVRVLHPCYLGAISSVAFLLPTMMECDFKGFQFFFCSMGKGLFTSILIVLVSSLLQSELLSSYLAICVENIHSFINCLSILTCLHHHVLS